MGINLSKLVEAYRKAPKETMGNLRDSLKSKEVRPTEFDLGSLFTNIFGWSAFQECRNGEQAHKIFEAAGAVSTAAFGNISGQIVYSAILEAYQDEEFVFSKLIPTVSTKLRTEKIAGIQQIGDKALVVNEGESYPLVGVGENWIDTPLTKKRGLICPVTREAIFFDRTGILLDRCAEVGKMLGLNKEKRAIDCVIDENAGAASAMTGGHRYHWQGTSYGTYQTSTPWINSVTSNALVDWTDIEAVELKLAAITDPFTGEPVTILPTHLIVTPQLLHTAKAIIGATENRLQVGGFATSGNLVTRVSPNTLVSYTIVSTRQLAARLGTDTSWFLGNPPAACRYMENFPMEVTQAPSGSHLEFNNDIVMQFKASEMGAYATFDPRFMAKSAA